MKVKNAHYKFNLEFKYESEYAAKPMNNHLLL